VGGKLTQCPMYEAAVERRTKHRDAGLDTVWRFEAAESKTAAPYSKRALKPNAPTISWC